MSRTGDEGGALSFEQRISFVSLPKNAPYLRNDDSLFSQFACLQTCVTLSRGINYRGHSRTPSHNLEILATYLQEMPYTAGAVATTKPPPAATAGAGNGRF
jgi:hypothetical protein